MKWIIFLGILTLSIFKLLIAQPQKEMMTKTRIWEEVKNPRSYSLSYADDILKQISKVGGPTPNADLSQVILIISKERKQTTIATNLSYVFAQSGLKTLLIDLDLRKPKIHSIYSLERKLGFTDLILNNVNSNIKKSIFENLHIIPGSLVPSSADLLEKKAVDEWLNRLREEYSVIIIDAPLALVAADISILAKKLMEYCLSAVS